MLVAAAAAGLFGGVYLWTAAILAAAVGTLLLWLRGLPPLGSASGVAAASDPGTRWLHRLDRSLVVLLGAIALQLIPLPTALVAILSPAHAGYLRATTLDGSLPAFIPLTLSPPATVHGLLAAFCAIGAFWTARAVFARGGIRFAIAGLAWTAVALVLIAFAQSAAGTPLVYGIWHPFDAGARPLGPFINRNHFGTWSLLVLFLCFGLLRWRRAAIPPPRGWRWRARLAHALDARTLILVLAIVLATVGIAVGASRSTMLALVCAAGYVAGIARRGGEAERTSWWAVALPLAALLAVLAFADVDRLAARLDETRQGGLAGRTAIWRDTLAVIRDFPLTGTGAGSYADSMRLYQRSDRMYFWNEAHNHYLQLIAEGGLLLLLPACAAISALSALGYHRLRRSADPLRWMRIGASAGLVAVAVQSLWETGLTLPANGMLAGIAAALLVHPMTALQTPPGSASHAAPRD